MLTFTSIVLERVPVTDVFSVIGTPLKIFQTLAILEVGRFLQSIVGGGGGGASEHFLEVNAVSLSVVARGKCSKAEASSKKMRTSFLHPCLF